MSSARAATPPPVAREAAPKAKNAARIQAGRTKADFTGIFHCAERKSRLKRKNNPFF
ncbi:MAG: hypothetical protein MR428_03695 [Mesosutterella sp.]|nr:hypothetical protein [Mesosutterella sp.]